MGKEVNDIISGAYCGRASRREKIRDLWVDWIWINGETKPE